MNKLFKVYTLEKGDHEEVNQKLVTIFDRQKFCLSYRKNTYLFWTKVTNN